MDYSIPTISMTAASDVVTFSGKIVNGAGKPIEGATVAITGIEKPASGSTGADGSYSIAGTLSKIDNNISVSVTHPAYESKAFDLDIVPLWK